MNRTNTGANTNTMQMLLDTLVLLCALGLDVLICYRNMSREDLMGFSILIGVFILVYILSNKEAYLYNVTMFYYLDRVHRKITKSFLIALIGTHGIPINF